MVLVDSAHEEQFLRFPEPIRMAQGPIWEQQRAAVTGLRGLIETGSLDPAAIPAPPRLPDDVADRYRALMATGTAVDTMLAELATIEQIHGEARDSDISTLGDIPLVVIRHGEPTPPFPPELGISEEDMGRYEEVWQELQEELAAMSSRGRLMVAGGAGHLIHHERPDLVVDAIHELVTAVRG
jgi:pimeloyl-ACP methyl ester carboxylesterase